MATRNSNGTFAEGNPGGPGRPPRPTEAQYLRALADACPPEVWTAIVERAVTDATAGEPKAREWLASYLLGRPKTDAKSLLAVAAVEATGVDEVDLAARERRVSDELRAMLAPRLG